MRSYGGSICSQVATASPPESTPTCGISPSWPAGDRVCIEPTAPTAVLARACTRVLVPSERCHTTTALPPESTPTWGSNAPWPASDRVWVALTAPAAVRARACTRLLAPSERSHTTTASPEEDCTATWG